jgi:hypothetical protein
MDIFFALFLMLIVILFFMAAMKAVDEKLIEQQRKFIEKELSLKKCPPHKWSYHPQTEKLCCINCNFTAGESSPHEQ